MHETSGNTEIDDKALFTLKDTNLNLSVITIKICQDYKECDNSIITMSVESIVYKLVNPLLTDDISCLSYHILETNYTPMGFFHNFLLEMLTAECRKFICIGVIYLVIYLFIHLNWFLIRFFIWTFWKIHFNVCVCVMYKSLFLYALYMWK